MGEYVEQKLVRMVFDNLFSTQVDKFTLLGNKHLLLVCMRLIVDDTTYKELTIS